MTPISLIYSNFRRILFQTSTASRKETQMHQITLLYEAVKDAMVKMPGPAVLLKLTKTQVIHTPVAMLLR